MKLNDRITSILKSYKEIKLSLSDVNKINESINKDMKVSKLRYNKKERESIESGSKIILRRLI